MNRYGDSYSRLAQKPRSRLGRRRDGRKDEDDLEGSQRSRKALVYPSEDRDNSRWGREGSGDEGGRRMRSLRQSFSCSLEAGAAWGPSTPPPPPPPYTSSEEEFVTTDLTVGSSSSSSAVKKRRPPSYFQELIEEYAELKKAADKKLAQVMEAVRELSRGKTKKKKSSAFPQNIDKFPTYSPESSKSKMHTSYSNSRMESQVRDIYR